MKFMDAMKQLRQLNAEQRRALETRVLCGRMRIARWLRLIDKLARFDATRDEGAPALKRALISCIALLVVGNGLALFMAGHSAAVFVPLALVDLPLLAVTIWLFRTSRILEEADLPNNLRLLVYPLLKILAEETSANQKVDLTVRLRGLQHEKNRVSGPRQISGGRKGSKTTETIYRDEWLHLAMLLADNTQLSLRITDMLRHRHIEKRNPRGKRKTKTKYKAATKLQADFRGPGQKDWTSINDVLFSECAHTGTNLRDVLSLISEYYKRRESGAGLSLG